MNSRVRGLLIAVAIAVNGFQAAPLPRNIQKSQFDSDVGREEMQRWTEILGAVGIHLTPEELAEKSYTVSKVFSDVRKEVLKPIQLPDDPVAASYAIGGLLQIELSRKQHLLELPDAATRLRAELQLLRQESRLLGDGALPPVQASDIGFHPN